MLDELDDLLELEKLVLLELDELTLELELDSINLSSNHSIKT
jgi:hypothetical protein